jgi:peptidoglycan/LPS O-acetylase OafA/YrhL
LNMTILAIGACMVIAAAAQSRWQAPRILTPLLRLGRRSYEVYLTHVFIVLGLFALFIAADKPMKAVPVLFFAVIVISAFLGELVARTYSEPLNRWLRKRWNDDSQRLGSVVDPRETTPREVALK